MKITKTTINYAARRNLGLEIKDDHVLILDQKSDNQTVLHYANTPKGLCFQSCQSSALVDSPDWVNDDGELREFLSYVRKELNFNGRRSVLHGVES